MPTTTTITVTVIADDPVSRAGIDAELQERSDLDLLPADRQDDATVAVVVVEEVDEEAARMVRALKRRGSPRPVLVVTNVDDRGLFTAVEAGACGLLRRREAVGDRLAGAIRAASDGDGSMPPDLLGRLLDQVSRLHDEILAPQGVHVSGMTEREIDVLRLVADGYPTSEIADRLCYSERTIKNVIHDVTSRLNLRNRSHAVAYALRRGLI